jgi:hypothetical protein
VRARGGLLSPSSRVWKPTRTRGTPLSLLGIRGAYQQQQVQQGPSGTFLPSLVPAGALASAPEKGLEGGVTRRRASQSGGNTVATALSSSQGRTSTTAKLVQRPPLAHSKKSSYQRITHGEKGDALGELAAVTAAVAEDESNMKVIDLGTTEPCADITGLPSFYQTEHYLAHTAASADADDADKEGGGRQTKS